MLHENITKLVLVLGALSLSACLSGGGGGGKTPTPTRGPLDFSAITYGRIYR